MQNREKPNKYKEQLKQHWFEICLTVVCMVFISVWINISSAQYQTSECAVIDGRLISVSPKVSGNVTHVYVDNNQEVKKGDLLLEIDPTYYEMRLHQAELNLRNARHKLASENTEKEQSKLGRTYEESKSPLSKFNFSKHKFNSYESNYDENYNEPQQNDKSCLLDDTTVKQNSSEEKISEEKTDISNEEDLPIDIKKLEGEVEQAKLDLSYTKVYATRDGIITNRDVEEGDYIEVAQPILSIIPKRLYVVASFITDEHNEIREGLPAIVKIPAYPYRRFKGIVEMVQMYSERMNDILPVKNNADNNRRILVRISFIEDYSAYNITPSTNVVAKVKTK